MKEMVSERLKKEIVWLTPQARREANIVANEIWKLGQKRHGGGNSVVILGETEVTWDAVTLYGQRGLKGTPYENTDYNGAKDVDLAIAWLRSPRLETRPVSHLRTEWYFFHLGRTIKEIRFLDNFGRERVVSSREADKDDLLPLLDIMRKQLRGVPELKLKAETGHKTPAVGEVKEIKFWSIVEEQLVKMDEEDRGKQKQLVLKMREVWAEGRKILGGIPRLGIKSSDPKFAGISLYSQEYLKEQAVEYEQPEPDIDLLIIRSAKAEGNVFERQLYHFFASVVLKKTLIEEINSKEIGREEHVATVEELNDLLRDLKEIEEQIGNKKLLEHVGKPSA